MAEEATINPDGTTTFSENGGSSDESTFTGEGIEPEEILNKVVKGIDPAFYLIFAFFIIVGLWFYSYKKSIKEKEERESFFMDMDGDKFNIQLPAAADEYYVIKEKCEDNGWEPGKVCSIPLFAQPFYWQIQFSWYALIFIKHFFNISRQQPPANAQEAAQGPARILAQALMKRAIADIPIVTHIQKESPGMNKLYAQSMCSVKQWYQAAESLVSTEVDEVRAEADEIEPGWSQVVWRQAMQYHNMLKNKQEMEVKQRAAAVEKAKLLEQEKLKPKLTPEEEKTLKEEAAEKAAQELLKMENDEQDKGNKKSKSASMSGMKKGFLSEKKTKK